MINSEKCLYCGTDRVVWNEKGKIGCIHCLKLFRKEYQAHLRQKDFELSSRFLQGKEFENFLRFESLSESRKILELERMASPFTYRLRIGRNLSGRIYPTAAEVPTQILREFLIYTLNVDRTFLGTKELPTRIPWGEGNLFSGDEDHLRWEVLAPTISELFRQIENSPLEKLEDQNLFDYDPEFGYVTSCPTNAGSGAKVSLKLSMKSWKNRLNASFKIPGFLEFYLENSSEYAVFYLKNFAFSQKNSFLNLVYYLALQVEPAL
ncbi:ATP:guanido phosphotransferase, C-terminal catalytic domain protein [Leptospira alstonii]|uniref:ATP:guanido phosphotransferase, C-terminal catalytic domain protein n=2 Tax=Leptospira alstonii TaxID=28452 RepID=M6CSD6_9LEPT|nr:ATP:guanido phosphotransferase, C-terminal catalytic domain protein [Leptospira alstonii]EMJ94862.1 ATP:guanido phosphotransferase, C-terminal catalytic domain protein [Leptospira alstonii serovar Sichuan str. 79601]EQA82628.1 ATP:guanido phosphotransferase, C-terminal catalytic domain protein [Leptospira alstonii serovar Pingchang str. 80-412]